jgi:hypothetical protein
MRRLLMTCLGTITAAMITMMVGLVLPSGAMASAMTPATEMQATSAWDGRRY